MTLQWKSKSVKRGQRNSAHCTFSSEIFGIAQICFTLKINFFNFSACSLWKDVTTSQMLKQMKKATFL